MPLVDCDGLEVMFMGLNGVDGRMELEESDGGGIGRGRESPTASLSV